MYNLIHLIILLNYFNKAEDSCLGPAQRGRCRREPVPPTIRHPGGVKQRGDPPFRSRALLEWLPGTHKGLVLLKRLVYVIKSN